MLVRVDADDASVLAHELRQDESIAADTTAQIHHRAIV